MELLVNVIPPSVVIKKLDNTTRITHLGMIMQDFPNANYIRNMRGLVRIIIESFEVCINGKNKDWNKFCGIAHLIA